MAQVLDDPTKMTAFKFEAPPGNQPKKFVKLARTDRMMAAVQVVSSGGENNLHSHVHSDGFWFVLKGRARFYSDFTVVAAELGRHEGILAPRGVKYWFESVGDEPLELLQVECSDVAGVDARLDRVDHEPQKESMRTLARVDAKVTT